MSVYVCVGHDEYVMVRGQCMRVIFLLSCVNSAEPSCQPKCCVLLSYLLSCQWRIELSSCDLFLTPYISVFPLCILKLCC